MYTDKQAVMREIVLKAYQFHGPQVFLMTPEYLLSESRRLTKAGLNREFVPTLEELAAVEEFLRSMEMAYAHGVLI